MRLLSKHLVFLRTRYVYYVCGIVSTLIIGSKEQGVLSYSSLFEESVFAALLVKGRRQSVLFEKGKFKSERTLMSSN